MGNRENTKRELAKVIATKPVDNSIIEWFHKNNRIRRLTGKLTECNTNIKQEVTR